jgi:ATP-dependent Clp protease ATP-binding subunit ClpB
LPDKAIDLVDEAAAKLKMEITSKPVVRVRCCCTLLQSALRAEAMLRVALQALDEIDRTVLKLEMERLSLSRPGCVSRGSMQCAHLCMS